MKITVISDTHGNSGILFEIVQRNADSDTFIHLGDGEREYEDVRSVFGTVPFIYIKGNCDYGSYPLNNVTVLGGKKFYMCHGNNFERARLKEFLAATASVNGCEIALFGHTHIPCNEMSNGILLFNPGSASLPRGGNPPTYGILDIDGSGGITARHEIAEFP